jgi:hypothetical protein
MEEEQCGVRDPIHHRMRWSQFVYHILFLFLFVSYQRPNCAVVPGLP